MKELTHASEQVFLNDLNSTNYIKVNIERDCNWRDTKAIEFEGEDECKIMRKHFLKAYEEIKNKSCKKDMR